MQLCKYEERFDQQVANYRLSEEQLNFTGAPGECIALAKEDADRHSILAMENDQLVTFFVLHENEGVEPYSDHADAILLRAFSTDYNQQGKGYAKQVLLLLPDLVREQFPHINEIVLAVNKRNIAAQSLYKNCGYVDEGVRRMSEKGELIIMSYYLSNEEG